MFESGHDKQPAWLCWYHPQEGRSAESQQTRQSAPSDSPRERKTGIVIAEKKTLIILAGANLEKDLREMKIVLC